MSIANQSFLKILRALIKKISTMSARPTMTDSSRAATSTAAGPSAREAIA